MKPGLFRGRDEERLVEEEREEGKKGGTRGFVPGGWVAWRRRCWMGGDGPRTGWGEAGRREKKQMCAGWEGPLRRAPTYMSSTSAHPIIGPPIVVLCHCLITKPVLMWKFLFSLSLGMTPLPHKPDHQRCASSLSHLPTQVRGRHEVRRCSRRGRGGGVTLAALGARARD